MDVGLKLSNYVGMGRLSWCQYLFKRNSCRRECFSLSAKLRLKLDPTFKVQESSENEIAKISVIDSRLERKRLMKLKGSNCANYYSKQQLKLDSLQLKHCQPLSYAIAQNEPLFVPKIVQFDNFKSEHSHNIHCRKFHTFSATCYKTGRILMNKSGRNSKLSSNKQLNGSGDGALCLNPIERLQPHIAVPIFPEGDIHFSPSMAEVQEAQRLFVSSTDHDIQFLKSAIHREHLPKHGLPEVGFIGRSNVGKSSLISSILEQAPGVEVRISKTPGHTKLLNFFKVGRKMCLVDMPGYGYRMPEHYTESVESYIGTRENLRQVFFLLDAKLGITSTDQIGLEMMEELGGPYTIVMTKIDKVSTATLLRNLMAVLEYRNRAPRCFPQAFLVSSHTGEGVALLKTFIASVTGNLKD